MNLSASSESGTAASKRTSVEPPRITAVRGDASADPTGCRLNQARSRAH